MGVAQRYPGPNRIKDQSGWGSGLGWLPAIQPAGMPSRHGGLAGLGQTEVPWYQTVSESIVDITQAVTPIVEEGVEIYRAIDQAITGDEQPVVRTTTVRRPVAVGGGSLLLLAGAAFLFMSGGKRGARRRR